MRSHVSNGKISFKASLLTYLLTSQACVCVWTRRQRVRQTSVKARCHGNNHSSIYAWSGNRQPRPSLPPPSTPLPPPPSPSSSSLCVHDVKIMVMWPQWCCRQYIKMIKQFKQNNWWNICKDPSICILDKYIYVKPFWSLIHIQQVVHCTIINGLYSHIAVDFFFFSVWYSTLCHCSSIHSVESKKFLSFHLFCFFSFFYEPPFSIHFMFMLKWSLSQNEHRSH